MPKRSAEEVGEYYDQNVKLAAASGAGLIWFMGKDHLSPPLLNIDQYALDANRWREAASERVLYMARRMGIRYGNKVLDLGTGIGGPGRDIVNMSGCHLFGVNISDNQLHNLRSMPEGQASPFIYAAKGDMQKLPFGHDRFDHVYSVNAVYHVSNPAAVIKDTNRVLKKGGRMGIDDWFVTDSITEETRQKLRTNWSTSADGFHNFDSFARTMEENKFEIIDITDFTPEAGEFISEDRFGRVYDQQVAPVLREVFPQLYGDYEGYKPEHAGLAVEQLRSDILYMGELYRNGQAVYRQIIGEKL